MRHLQNIGGSDKPTPVLISIKSTASMLGGISTSMVRKLLDTGRLRGVRIGRRRLIVASSAVDLAAGGK